MSCALWVTVITYMALCILALAGTLTYVIFLIESSKPKGIIELIFVIAALLLCAALCFVKGYSLINEEKLRRQQVEFDKQSSVYE